MTVLIDTNIILDVLCDRKRFVSDSAQIFRLCEIRKIEGFVSALSIPNIIYIMRKEIDNEKIKEILFKLSSIFSVAELRESDLKKAVDLDFSDYEDALQSVCAARIKADHIITRNLKDYKNSAVPAIAPDEFLRLLQ